MTTMIYCKNEAHNLLSIYLKFNAHEYHLFDQKYTKGVETNFSESTPLGKAIARRNNSNFAVSKTAEKIIVYVRRLERELGAEIFESKDKKLFKRACAFNKYHACAPVDDICA